MLWHLIVKTIRDEHMIFVGGDQELARAALGEVQAYIGAQGVVRIADRLTLQADEITAGQIVDRYIRSPNRRRRGD